MTKAAKQSGQAGRTMKAKPTSLDRDLIVDYIQDFRKKKKSEGEIVPANVTLPIVWFGNSKEYFAEDNPLRVVTVGLNPSCEEFAEKRFKAVRLDRADAPEKLAETLDAYFSVNAYGWFYDFQRILTALGGSYRGAGARAIHIDMFSAIATSTKWGKLSGLQKRRLANLGLFHRLLRNLAPDTIVYSGSLDFLRSEFVKKGFKLLQFYPDNPLTAHTRLLERNNEDGTRTILLYGTNTRMGPFRLLKDDELKLIAKKWDLQG